jgi:hypothetical protein
LAKEKAEKEREIEIAKNREALVSLMKNVFSKIKIRMLEG